MATAIQTKKDELILVETWLCDECGESVYSAVGPNYCTGCGAEFEQVKPLEGK
jgi:rubrerythrin